MDKTKTARVDEIWVVFSFSLYAVQHTAWASQLQRMLLCTITHHGTLGSKINARFIDSPYALEK